MPAIAPLLKVAAKYGPQAYAVGRKTLDKLRPQVEAYLLAQRNDGYVVEWPSSSGTFQFVLDADRSRVIDSFPTAAPHLHQAVLAAPSDRYVHHTAHWVAKAKARARAAGELPRGALARVPRRGGRAEGKSRPDA